MLSEDFREIEYMVINNKLYEMELQMNAKCHLLRNRITYKVQ